MLTMDIYTIADGCTMTLTLCMIVPSSRDGVIFLAFGHFAMSSHLRCPDSTDAHCPLLGAQGPRPQRGVPSPRVRAHFLSRVQNSTNVQQSGMDTNWYTCTAVWNGH
jgi:hypothetical protein